MYGLFDTEADCWLGDDKGPRTFGNFEVARMAAQVFEAQICGADLAGRIKAREIPENAWHLKDELPVKRSALKAIQNIEGGRTQ